MRKLFMSITIIMTVLILTGCVNSDISLNIDKKGNASLSAQILSSDYLMNGINEQDLKSNYDNVEKITEPGKSGYKITEKLGNIKDLNLKDNKGLSQYSDIVNIKKEETFFYTTYDVNIKLKDYMQKNISNEEMGVLNLLGSNFDLNFHFNAPMKLIESNASSSSEKDGIYTYNWDFNLGNIENIQASAKIPNIKNILIVAAISLVVIIGLAIFIIKKRKNKK
ncbi:MAG: hypothetical protein RR904_07100 [Bacilli bacterium]|uniref:hypothetical protein n=1 Tax=Paraclostridium sp. TaxID=2023273 RepID=UPI003AA29329